MSQLCRLNMVCHISHKKSHNVDIPWNDVISDWPSSHCCHRLSSSMWCGIQNTYRSQITHTAWWFISSEAIFWRSHHFKECWYRLPPPPQSFSMWLLFMGASEKRGVPNTISNPYSAETKYWRGNNQHSREHNCFTPYKVCIFDSQNVFIKMYNKTNVTWIFKSDL